MIEVTHTLSESRRRRIAVITVGRSDFSLFRPLLARARDFPNLELALIVSGSHFLSRFGFTVSDIERFGYPIHQKLDFMVDDDSPAAVAASIGRGVECFGRFFSLERWDLILVLGDRFEMLCPALASLPFRIPLAHIHGGEETAGSFDNQIRHAISKLSHLHFVSTERYRDRLLAIGESAERVFVSGAPALDGFVEHIPASREVLRRELGFDPENAVLVTYHPETLGSFSPIEEAAIVVKALERIPGRILITAPNPDPGGRILREAFESFAQRNTRVIFRESLGTELFNSILSHIGVMIGNSSSGIIEAPMTCKPVVNIGGRQQGRERGKNVIDVELDSESIVSGYSQAVLPSFQESLREVRNPYWHGGAAEIILRTLSSFPLDTALLRKQCVLGRVKS